MPRSRAISVLLVASLLLSNSAVFAQDAQHPDALPVASAGAAYKYVFRLADDETRASGALKWSLRRGELPPGLALDPSGTLSGHIGATITGRFVFEVQVQDATGASGTMWFALEVRPQLRIARAPQTLRIANSMHEEARSAVSAPDSVVDSNGNGAAPGPFVTAVTKTRTAAPPAPAPASQIGSPAPSSQEDCEEEKRLNKKLTDCRETFAAGAHLGVVIDTFGSDSTLAYLNPNAATPVKERFSAGFNFEYRLFGTPAETTERSPFRKPQLWIFGETLHAVRSTEFDCTANQLFCTNEGFIVPPNPQQSFFAILRAASSLEAFAGARFEFLRVQPRELPPANLYVKGQLGFLKVSGRPDDVVDVHHIGLGLMTTRGKFQSSYLEAGFGRTDLFRNKSKDRWKLDGQLNIDLGRGVGFYAQMIVDADAGYGSDSVQSYLGFNFDLKKVSNCWFRKNCD